MANICRFLWLVIKTEDKKFEAFKAKVTQIQVLNINSLKLQNLSKFQLLFSYFFQTSIKSSKIFF